MIGVQRRYRGRSGYEAFKEDVDRSLVDQQIRAHQPPDNFDASLAHAPIGSIDLLVAQVPRLESRRSAADSDAPGVFLLFTERGEGTIDFGANSAPIDRNHVVVVPANKRFFVDYSVPPTVAFLGLSDELVEQRYPMLRGQAKSIGSDAPVDWCRRTVFGMARSMKSFEPDSTAELESVLHSSVALLSRSLGGQSRLPLLRFEARRAIENWTELRTLNVASLSMELGVSQRHLHRSFLGSTTSVAKAIRKRRLEEARFLLSSRQRTVTEVAYAVGFSGPSHLATWFREHYGVTPATYQEDVTDLT